MFERKPPQTLSPRITAPLEMNLPAQQLPVTLMTPEAQARRARGMPTETEIAVLRMIRDSPEKREAPVIAREISKSREHTARLLKKMSDAGYLTRKEEVWPYTYVLTERAQRLLENQL